MIFNCFYKSKIFFKSYVSALTNSENRLHVPPGLGKLKKFSRLPDRVEELWGVVVLNGNLEELCHWWKYGDMN